MKCFKAVVPADTTTHQVKLCLSPNKDKTQHNFLKVAQMGTDLGRVFKKREDDVCYKWE